MIYDDEMWYPYDDRYPYDECPDLMDDSRYVHQHIWESESARSNAERQWAAYVRLYEQTTGHSADGCEWEDGYSVDTLYEAWEKGLTVKAYIRGERA